MISIIIQARMGSTRFPGKIMEIIRGKTMLEMVVLRAKRSKKADNVIVATSRNKENTVLSKKAEELGVPCFHGDEDDVLDRYFQCAKRYGSDVIVRITGDCPVIDPAIIDDTISFFEKKGVNYVSNVHPPTFPDGMDVEVFDFASLEKAWKEASLPSEREHVTPYIWKNDKKFTTANLTNKEDLSRYRFTVDEKEDMTFLSEVLKRIDGEDYSMEDLIRVIRNNPKLLKINGMYRRNEGFERSIKADKDEI